LHPIFRDKEDLSGGGALPERLKTALEESDALIVLCTPTSATRHWVNEEVMAFQRLGRGDRIFPVLANPDKGTDELPTHENLPPALKDSGLLAADLREIKRPGGRVIGDGREGGRLKLIAGLLGVPLDALVRRERARQRFLLMGMATASLVFAGLALAAAWFGWEAEQQRRQAFEALARIFAERSWQAIERGNSPLGARYALAGWTAARSNENEFGSALAHVLFSANESRQLLGHEGGLEDAVFSPDGERVATASMDHTARVWSVDGRATTVMREHAGDVVSVRFSPDGTRLVTASMDHTARVWDASTGRRLLVLRGHTRAVRSAVFDRSGTLIATASDDESARVWNASTGDEIARLPGRASTVSFSPDGTRVLTDSGLWQVTGRQIMSLDELSEGPSFNHDGSEIIAAGIGGARVWDASSGRLIAVLQGHSQPVYVAAFNADGTQIVTGSGDHTAMLWARDAGGEWIGTAILRGHVGEIRRAMFSPDGARVLTTASGDRTARVWLASSGELSAIATLQGHEGDVSNGVFSPDGACIVTTSRDGTARLWNFPFGREIATLRPSGSYAYITFDAAFDARGDTLVTASFENTAHVWRRAGDAPVPWHAAAVLHGHTGPVRSVAISAQGTRVATASDDGVARIWEESAGEWRSVRELRDHRAGLNDVAFSADGRQVVTASDDGTARVWNAANGRPLAVLQVNNEVRSVTFAPDGRRIVLTTVGDGAQVWRLAEENPSQWRRTLAPDGFAIDAAFNAAGDRVATASTDDVVRVWNAETGDLLLSL
jgi:WD40 repeat protein